MVSLTAIWIFQWQFDSILIFNFDFAMGKSVSLHLTALNSVRDWFINDFIFHFSGENTGVRNWFIRRRVESNPFQRVERLCVIRWFIPSRNVGIYVEKPELPGVRSTRADFLSLMYRHTFEIDRDSFMWIREFGASFFANLLYSQRRNALWINEITVQIGM